MASHSRYSRLAKLRFLLAYFFHKLMVLVEVRQPRFRFFVYEAMYSACKFCEYQSQLAYPFRDETIVTRFGKFLIRRGTSDAAGVSPAYERSDVNYLLKLVNSLLSKGRRVIFLDIGADIGAYSTTLLNHFPSPQLQVMAFEPMPQSFDLLRRNLALNGHQEGQRLRLFNCAVGDKDERVRLHFDALAPGCSGLAHGTSPETSAEVEAHSLDQLLSSHLQSCDDIIMKVDVEGMEIPVLRGAQQILSSGKAVHLMVEDFVDEAILAYLDGSTKWKFVAKRTDYNSWWSST